MTLTRTKTFSEIIIENKIINTGQLNSLIKKHKNSKKPLSWMLVNEGYLNEEEISRILIEHQEKLKIGDLLVQMNLITEEHLQFALKKAKYNERLGDVLVRENLITAEDFVRILSLQLGIPRMIPLKEIIDIDLVLKTNERYLRSNFILPAFKTGDILTCIMADPLDIDTIDIMSARFECEIETAIALKSEITFAISQVFSAKVLSDKTRKFGIDTTVMSKFLVIDSDKTTKEQNIIVSLLNHIIGDAVKDGASDVHIEPQPTKLVIRNRIDGILYRKSDLPRHIIPMLSSRLKAICELDVAQKMHPQDGKISTKLGTREIDLRVAIYPSEYGENITIRILDRAAVLVDMTKLGFNPLHKKKYETILNYPAGMILITGPTGSGKTTTLYSSLNYLKNKNNKIITVEDPVEYTLPGITQAQYNFATGTTYETFLKAMMRQDPDVIMVGEIRDHAAAEVTIQASLTGHKVFSTFHTEDTTGALLRLMDMGIETFLISSTVICVIAQRLVRKICPHCRVSYKPPQKTLDSFNVSEINFEKHKFFKGKGCSSCRDTGFRGRIGIFELLTLDDSVRDSILQRKSSSEIRKLARISTGMLSMMEDGFYKALKGFTTLEEVLRVIHTEESTTWESRTADNVISICEDTEPEKPMPVKLTSVQKVDDKSIAQETPASSDKKSKVTDKSTTQGTPASSDKKSKDKPFSLLFRNSGITPKL